eukprot:1185124-Prorocentrum_minimum.AAC.6
MGAVGSVLGETRQTKSQNVEETYEHKSSNIDTLVWVSQTVKWALAVTVRGNYPDEAHGA